ncbi:MAG: hypothetical protein EBR82_49310 [Caulobacteraceae bacterium]|nr:hypothetical protein [Caulobacteraceae bacterium]
MSTHWTELPKLDSLWFDKQESQLVRVTAYHVDGTRVLVLFNKGKYPYDVGSEWSSVWDIRFTKEQA